MSAELRGCAIIAKRQLAFARVLARSWSAHHPGSPFVVFVLDGWRGFIEPAEEPFELLDQEHLDVPGYRELVQSADAAHLAEAAKPRLLRALLDLPGTESVVWLDPHSRVYAPLGDGLPAPASRGEAVLVARTRRVPPGDGRFPDPSEFIAAGPFNHGFLGLSRGRVVDHLLRQWADRAVRQPANGVLGEPARELFEFGRWTDFLPVLLPTRIVADPGCGVSYWNLHERELRRTADGFAVADGPLRWFHFERYDPDALHQLSPVQNRIQLFREPVLAELCAHYRAELLSAEHETCRHWPYGPAAQGRQRGRRTAEAGASSREPAATRRTLGARLVDLEHLVTDLKRQGRSRVAIASEVARAVNPLPRSQRVARWSRRGARLHRPGRPASLGVNVVGYLAGAVGIGEVGRQASAALQESGVPVQPIAVPALYSRNDHPFHSVTLADACHPVNLVCFNADMFPAWRREAGEQFFRRRYTIGLWQWEIASFPARFHPAFDYLDEVWVGSEHIAAAMRGAADKPVTRITIPVVPDPPAERPRDLPDGFTFLFMFDHLSVFERKNPLGLISAFGRAFPDAADVSLLVKVVNEERRPADHALLRTHAARHPNVRLRSGYLSPGEKNALIAACDCYVSLHRGEGFGLTLAEAMYFRRPVIATGYSGNLDFMNDENSFLVRHALTPIGPGSEPYPADAEWAEPDLEHAAELMRRVHAEPGEAARVAERAAADIRRTHSRQAAGATMKHRLREIVDTW